MLMATLVCSSFAACGAEDSADEEVAVEEGTSVDDTEEEVAETKEETSEDELAQESEAEPETDYSTEFAEALATAEIYGNSDGKKYDNWQAAYKAKINEFIKDIPEYDFTYSLIYLNEDDIPELLINTNGDNDIGVYLLTYNGDDKSVNVSSTGSLMFTYMPRENVLNSTGVVLGANYDNLISIRDGQWVELGYGEQGTGDPWAEDSYDGDGNIIVDSWTWNGQELGSEEAYAEKFLTYYSYGKAEVVDDYCSEDEILSRIAEL